MAGPLTPEDIDLAVARGVLSPAAAQAMKANPNKFNMLGPGVSPTPMLYSAPMATPAADASMVPNHVGLGDPAVPIIAGMQSGGVAAPIDAPAYNPAADWQKAAPVAPAGPAAAPPAPPPMLAKGGTHIPPPLPSSVATGPKLPGAAPHPSGSAAFGSPKPAPNVDNFGKAPAQIAMEKEQLAHEGVMGGLQIDQSKIDQSTAEAGAAHMANTAIALEKREVALAKSAAQRKSFLNDYNHATETAVEDYQKSEVDPNKFWAKQGAAGNFITMIGVALSGVAQSIRAGAGLDPGENGAMKMVEQFIARDIDAQKANIAKKGAGIEARKGLYASYLQQFGSEDAAELTAYQAYLTKARAQVDAYAASTSVKEVKLRAQALGESIDNRISQIKNANDLTGQKMYADYQAKMAQQAAAVAAEGKARNKAIFDANLKAKTEQITKSGGMVVPAQSDITLANGTVIPAGLPVAVNAKGEIDMAGTESLSKIETVNVPVVQPGGGIAYTAVPVTKGTHGEAAKKAAGAASAINALEALEAAANMPGTWTGEKKKLYEQALSNYATSYGVAKGMGALSADDRKIIAATVPDVPTYGIGYLSDAQKKQLAAQKKQMADDAAAAITAFGPADAAGPAPLTSAGPAK
jgi:hypothetical protein